MAAPHPEHRAVAQELTAARIRSGRPLREVAEAVGLPEADLSALEDSRFSAFGSLAAAKARVRIYAAYLGLDAEALLERLSLPYDRPAEHPRRRSHPELAGTRWRLRLLLALALLAMIVGLISVGVALLVANQAAAASAS